MKTISVVTSCHNEEGNLQEFYDRRVIDALKKFHEPYPCFRGLISEIGYFFYILLFWRTFNLGLAPMVIGLFFFSSVQLIFIGIIGEYIGAVLTQVKNKPWVIEDERINF